MLTLQLRSSLAVILSIFVAASPAPLMAKTPKTAETSRLSGRITLENGENAADVRIVMRRMESEAPPLEARTDSRGHYVFKAVRYGYYELAFEKDGVAYASNRLLDIPPDEKVEADFTLGGFRPEDAETALALDDPLPLLGPETRAAGVARLAENFGPSGWAWFRTGKGVAVLVGGGALAVVALIALSDPNPIPNEPVASVAAP